MIFVEILFNKLKKWTIYLKLNLKKNNLSKIWVLVKNIILFTDIWSLQNRIKIDRWKNKKLKLPPNHWMSSVVISNKKQKSQFDKCKKKDKKI